MTANVLKVSFEGDDKNGFKLDYDDGCTSL